MPKKNTPTVEGTEETSIALNSDCVTKRSRLKIRLLTPAEIEEVKQQVKSEDYQ